MKPEEMCGTCIHRNGRMAAYKKDHWCGNHTGGRIGGISWTMKRSAAPASTTENREANGCVSMSTAMGSH